MRVSAQSVEAQPNVVASGLDDADRSTSWGESQPIAWVPVDALLISGSPRRAGEDPDHVRLLAETTETLPPILVHRPTMRVIDGVHRLRAARLNGASEIRARLLDCDENAAFVVAVKANVKHGLPLSHSDRLAAAARILASHPQWSDRAVAAATGLSDKTVSRVRACSTSETAESNTRLGRDGRVRPVDSRSRRQHAATIISRRPTAALREVARTTGLSAATVRDVRQRLERGEDPVPDRYQPAGADLGASAAPVPDRDPQAVPAANEVRVRRAANAIDPDTLLEKLRQDPSLRFSEAGRLAVRYLDRHLVDTDGLENLEHGLPDHWAPVVANLARSCATNWARLAEQLELRT
jgi:ParB-like chromosome segregation protein Spo0J